MLTVEIREDIDVFDDLAKWWNTQPGPMRSVFLRSEWFRTLASTVTPSGSLRVFLVMDGDDPVAALPMYRSGRRLRSLTETSTEDFDVIHGGDPKPVGYLVSELNRHTMFRFEALVEGSVLINVSDRQRRWHNDNETRHAIIDLSQGSEHFFSHLSRNMRSNLRRGLKALEEMGKVTVGAHPDHDRIDDVLAQGLALEAAGWKGQSDHAIMSSSRRLAFFKELARVAEENGWLRLGTLHVDDRLVAFQYDLEYAGRQVLLITCFDESLEKGSAGNVLLWKTLEAGMERGVTAYELGSVGGRKAWKLRWTSQTSPRLYVVAFGSNPDGRIASLAWEGRTRIKALQRRAFSGVA
ncbi:MAG TPA: GNAT family N-acetyltransferase [Acidimicrobiia bacterium]|nr:GNAT family N-acetyltransferase [Acidimicrobiia bacterium]